MSFRILINPDIIEDVDSIDSDMSTTVKGTVSVTGPSDLFVCGNVTSWSSFLPGRLSFLSRGWLLYICRVIHGRIRSTIRKLFYDVLYGFFPFLFLSGSKWGSHWHTPWGTGWGVILFILTTFGKFYRLVNFRFIKQDFRISFNIL